MLLEGFYVESEIPLLKFINPVTRDEAKDTLLKEQQLLCEQDAPTEILSFEEAKKRKLDLF